MKKLITLLILTVISASAFCKTITVTSGSDSGVGTLRQAVADASANDTIDFASNVSTIVLSNQLIFNKNLTVNGNPTTKTIISVAAGYYLWEFIIQKDMKVVVNNLVFRDVSITSTCDGAVVNFGILAVSNCEFTNNKILRLGAGILNKTGGILYVEKCKFYKNECGEGGALGASSNTINYISDCVFNNNIGPKGSAIYNSGNMTIINCSLNNNSTSSGTIVGAGYGTVYSNGDNINLINCIFNSNAGTYCSTIANDMNNTAFVANTLFVNNTCSSNSSSATIFNGITSSYSSTLTLVNNTIADNNTIGVYNNNGIATLNNNIMWNNSSDLHTVNGGIIAANNLIGNSNINLLGNGNILNTDPLFVGNGDYTLQENSPAINHGNNSLLPDTILTDLLGKARFSGISVDLGAYEYQSTSADILHKYNSKLRIYSQGHTIYITDASSAVNIYNVMGELITQGNGSVFSVSNTGVYIVHADNVVRKVIIQ